MTATCRSNAELGVTSITLPQLHAEEMVVVLGEVLGQLEARELVVGRDAPHHAGGLEVDQVAVGGAARQLGQAVARCRRC